MCDLSKSVEEKGKKQGITETLLASIRNLMDSMRWTAEQAMAALKVPEEERAKYLELLGKP